VKNNPLHPKNEQPNLTWKDALERANQSPRCGAKTRKQVPCKSPAMKNGRCRMHGGKSTGAPKGNQNAYKTGKHTEAMVGKLRNYNRLISSLLSY